jgi:hypothetical protein
MKPVRHTARRSALSTSENAVRIALEILAPTSTLEVDFHSLDADSIEIDWVIKPGQSHDAEAVCSDVRPSEHSPSIAREIPIPADCVLSASDFTFRLTGLPPVIRLVLILGRQLPAWFALAAWPRSSAVAESPPPFNLWPGLIHSEIASIDRMGVQLLNCFPRLFFRPHLNECESP